VTRDEIRKMKLDAIAEDEQWIAKATAVMRSCDGDVPSRRLIACIETSTGCESSCRRSPTISGSVFSWFALVG